MPSRQLKRHPLLRCFAVLAACLASIAHAGDFIFAEDFDITPSCTGVTPPAVLIATSPAERNSTLGTLNRFLIHVRSCGFTGTVTLDDNDAAFTWSVLLDPGTLMIQSGKTTNVALDVQVPTNGAAVASSISVDAFTTSTPASHAQVNLTIANEWVYTFANGTGFGDHHFPETLRLKLGTKVRFINQDTTAAHRVHADGDNGFEHETSDLPLGSEYDQTPTKVGPYDFFCHDHPASPLTSLIVE